MNKENIDADELYIDEDVIDFCKEEHAESLTQKLDDVVKDNLSTNNYRSEGVETAVNLVKQMFLDDNHLKIFVENIKLKLQEGEHTHQKMLPLQRC